MGIFEAVRLYRSLRPDLRQAIKDQELHDTRTVGAWLEDFRALSLADAAGDKARDAARKWLIILMISALVLLFLTPFSAVFGQNWITLGFLGLFGLSLVGGIVLWVALRLVRRFDMPNRLRQSIAPFVAAIGQDMRDDAELTLDINLNPVAHKEFQIDEVEDNPGRFRYPKVKETHYQLCWLHGTGILADRNAVEFAVSDFVRKRRVTKKNPRGKIKTKTKYKTKHTVTFVLGVKSGRYVVDPDAPIVKDDGAKKVLRLREKIKTDGVDIGPAPATLMRLPQRLYSHLQGAPA